MPWNQVVNLKTKTKLNLNLNYVNEMDIFRYAQNSQFWLLQLREDLITLMILHQLQLN